LTYKFTGKERDSESGLDDFGAEARKRRYAEQDSRLLLENNPSIG
jgi:hypothetical protein